MRRSLKVGIYTLVSFTLLVFLLGAITLGRKGAKASSNRMESNIGSVQFGYDTESADMSDSVSNKTADSAANSFTYDKLQIKWNGEDIFITESEEIDDIAIYVLSGDYKRNIYSTNYVVGKNKTLKINNKSLTDSLEILLPAYSFSEKITIDAPCANIYLDGVETSDLKVVTDFGNVLAKDIIGDAMYISSESGIIYTIGGKFITVEIQSDTGNISANSNADEFYLSSDSGNITFEPVTDWVRADIAAQNGNIVLNLTSEYAHTIEVKPSAHPVEFDDGLEYEVTNNKYVFKDGSADINIQSGTGTISVITEE